jgi:hypothetical protein
VGISKPLAMKQKSWHALGRIVRMSLSFMIVALSIDHRDEAPRSGEIDSFQKDVRGFVQALYLSMGSKGWRPYLTLRKLTADQIACSI